MTPSILALLTLPVCTLLAGALLLRRACPCAASSRRACRDAQVRKGVAAWFPVRAAEITELPCSSVRGADKLSVPATPDLRDPPATQLARPAAMPPILTSLTHLSCRDLLLCPLPDHDNLTHCLAHTHCHDPCAACPEFHAVGTLAKVLRVCKLATNNGMLTCPTNSAYSAIACVSHSVALVLASPQASPLFVLGWDSKLIW